jgi:hypothetical protein
LRTFARKFRQATIRTALAGAAVCTAAPAHAQESSLLRSLIERVIVGELESHDSQDTAWYDETSKDKRKVVQFNLFGREIDRKVASWTEEAKTWFWLENPAQTLSIELTHFAIRDARVEFGLSARAKVGFRVWGRIPRLAKGNASGTAWVTLQIEGSTALAGGKFADSRITRLEGTLRELQFNNDLASPLENLVTDALNDHVKHKNKKLRESVEKAINKAKI